MPGRFLSRLVVAAFRVVNRFVPWYRLPRYVGAMNLYAFREVLREQNLYDTETPASTDGAIGRTPEPSHLYARTCDGSFNDLSDPGMGCKGARFGRNFPLKDVHPEPEPGLLTPSPHVVSCRLLARKEFVPASTLNLLAGAWIQFQTHDWFDHGEPRPGREFRVPADPSGAWHENPMRIRRTPPDPTWSSAEGVPQTFRNAGSHWWDGSQIYGSDRETFARLRLGRDGKLRVDEGGLLPVDPETGAELTGLTANWWIGMTLLHTLFTLEHNAICDRLRAAYPLWDDEHLFQTARLVNAALMAKIHTVEWTPGILAHPTLEIGMGANWWGLATERVTRLVGRISDSESISGIPGSLVDHHGVRFALTEEFVSVYRLHPLMPDAVDLRSAETGRLLKSFPMPEVAGQTARSRVLRHCTMTDAFYSFGVAHPGAIRLHNYPNFLRRLERPDGEVLDLAAVDVMRDRERGVPRYNRFRQLFHKPRVRAFEQITSDAEWAREMREVYGGDVDRVDLLVGLLAEDLPPGFGFSDTAFRVFILMASRRLKSDRFFTTDYRPEIYTKAGLEWINENDMASVLLRHYPALKPALRGVGNAFAPWNRVAAAAARAGAELAPAETVARETAGPRAA